MLDLEGAELPPDGAAVPDGLDLDGAEDIHFHHSSGVGEAFWACGKVLGASRGWAVNMLRPWPESNTSRGDTTQNREALQ